MKQKIKETELAQIIIQYLKSPLRQLFGEVPNGPKIVDLVSQENGLTAAIEFKTSFNLSVLEQANYNKRMFDFSFVAIPKTKKSFAYDIAKMLGIGIIECNLKSRTPIVQIILPAKQNTEVNPKHRPKLKEWQKLNVDNCGTQSTRVTQFSFFVQSAEEALLANGPLEPHLLFKKVFRHYANINSMKSSMRKYIEEGIITSIGYDNKKFYIKTKS